MSLQVWRTLSEHHNFQQGQRQQHCTAGQETPVSLSQRLTGMFIPQQFVESLIMELKHLHRVARQDSDPASSS